MNKIYQKNPYLLILLALGIIVRIYVFSIFIFQYRILYQPFFMFGKFGPYYIPLLILILFGTIGWLSVYNDAKTISAGKAFVKEEAMNHLTWKPNSWAFLVFFLWSLAFPTYLIYRKKIFDVNNKR